MTWDYGQYDSAYDFDGILNYGDNKSEPGWKMEIP
jgi:hypothetical protein